MIATVSGLVPRCPDAREPQFFHGRDRDAGESRVHEGSDRGSPLGIELFLDETAEIVIVQHHVDGVAPEVRASKR